MAQSRRARGGTQFGLPAQTFQEGITPNFYHAGSFLAPT
jgi:hypothetical protein